MFFFPEYIHHIIVEITTYHALYCKIIHKIEILKMRRYMGSQIFSLAQQNAGLSV